MKNFSFKKHGDKLLFFMALAVLVAGTSFGVAALFRSLNKMAVQAGAVSIVFTQWWQEDLEKGTLDALVKEFEGLHGDIKVVLNGIPYEDLRFNLFNAALIEKKQAPAGDVLALDTLWVPELLKRKIIENQSGSLSPQAPLLSFTNVLYYNTGILKEAGFTRPPKSRGEFLAYARALGSGKVRALAMGAGSFRGIYDDVFPWIWSAGAQLIKDGKPALGYQPLIESLSFLVSLNKEGLIVPGAFSADSKKKIEDFITGRAAFMITTARDIAFVREQMGDEAFGITSVPIPDNFTGMSYFAAAAWSAGINSASARKKEAALFVDFLAGKSALLSEKAKAVPGTGVSPPAPDPFYSKVWDIAISGESARDFAGLPWTELEEIFREELSVLFEGKTSPADAAQAIQEKWELALEEFWKE